MLVGKSEEKRSVGRPSYRWEDNINTDVKEIECEDVDCIQPTQDRAPVADFCEHGNEPSGFLKGG
jgi:hypothetical protein